jgi:hypothetical protein
MRMHVRCAQPPINGDNTTQQIKAGYDEVDFIGGWLRAFAAADRRVLFADTS